MDKADVILIIDKCLEKEGSCAIIYLTNGVDFLIDTKPSFYNFIMKFPMKFNYEEHEIVETINVSYSSILYITETSIENLKIISEHFTNQMVVEDGFQG